MACSLDVTGGEWGVPSPFGLIPILRASDSLADYPM
jgi:hypothetical protein